MMSHKSGKDNTADMFFNLLMGFTLYRIKNYCFKNGVYVTQ
jgi:hypothetical protein